MGIPELTEGDFPGAFQAADENAKTSQFVHFPSLFFLFHPHPSAPFTSYDMMKNGITEGLPLNL